MASNGNTNGNQEISYAPSSKVEDSVPVERMEPELKKVGWTIRLMHAIS